MTVKELIERLNGFDPNAPVVVWDDEIDEPALAEVEQSTANGRRVAMITVGVLFRNAV